MDTPQKVDPLKLGEDMTPGTRDEAYYDFWEERKARVVKRLDLDLDEVSDEDPENNFLKVSGVVLKRYNAERMIVRVTLVGQPGVTSKGDAVVTFFGMDETGEICFTAYREQVKMVLELAKVGGVIEIQGFYAEKEKVGRFSRSGTGSGVRLTLVDTSQICASESKIIPEIPYNFVPLSDLDSRSLDDIVDVRGIIVRVTGLKDFDSRDVFITDSQDNTVKVSLYKHWNNTVGQADRFKCLVLRRAVVRELETGKKCLRADWNTLVQVDPNLEEVSKIKEWFAAVTNTDD